MDFCAGTVIRLIPDPVNERICLWDHCPSKESIFLHIVCHGWIAWLNFFDWFVFVIVAALAFIKTKAK